MRKILKPYLEAVRKTSPVPVNDDEAEDIAERDVILAKLLRARDVVSRATREQRAVYKAAVRSRGKRRRAFHSFVPDNALGGGWSSQR